MDPFRPYSPPPEDHAPPLYIDAALVVLVKPAGLLSAPGRGPDKEDCLLSRGQPRFGELFLVHRLDMDTSGLLILARSREAHSRLSAQFRERRIDKTYEAMVAGRVAADWGEIELPLSCDWPRRPRQQVDFLRGRPSTTRFRVLNRDPAQGRTRLELTPITGRSHQLRVHCLALGHPIIGDPLYGKAGERLLLHARRIAFAHPLSARPLAFEDAPPF